MLAINTRIAGLAVAIAIAIAGIAASPARADTPFTLTLTPPAATAVGQPFVIHATGTDPIDQGALYLEVDEIAANVASTCPGDYSAGGQLAASTGGTLVALDVRENLDGSGRFDEPIGFTPSAAGSIIFCAYTDDGALDTLATGTLSVMIAANATPSATTPSTTSPSTTAPSTTTPSNASPKSSPATIYRNALARCAALRGTRKITCIERARLARALARCTSVKGTASQKRCRAAARTRYRV
jgi:hypothetical protein